MQWLFITLYKVSIEFTAMCILIYFQFLCNYRLVVKFIKLKEIPKFLKKIFFYHFRGIWYTLSEQFPLILALHFWIVQWIFDKNLKAVTFKKKQDYGYDSSEIQCLQTLRFKILERNINMIFIFMCLSKYVHLLCHLHCMTVIRSLVFEKLTICKGCDVSDGPQNHW